MTGSCEIDISAESANRSTGKRYSGHISVSVFVKASVFVIIKVR